MKAMILAAGEGRRMRPLTLKTPKPLLKVDGKCLIEYHIDKLKAAGVLDIIINIAYLGELIKETLGDGARLGVRIQYSEEPEPLETGGAIAHALSVLGDQPFILINADIWTDYPFSSLMHFNFQQKNSANLAHLILVKNPEHNAQGDFCIDQGMLIDLSEEGSIGLTFSGISIIHPFLIDTYPHKRQKFPLVEVFRWAIQNSTITAEQYLGSWTDVGTPKRLQSLQAQ